ncbi:MAG TPA: hypothetical protein VGG28_03675 [Kofleriaceae bacterium]|jgi:hypothetical protein
MRVWLAAVAIVACRVPDDQFPITDAPSPNNSDATLDAPGSSCATLDSFGGLVPVPSLGPASSVARFSPDELTAYFAIDTGSNTIQQLVYATRNEIDDPFGSAMFVSAADSSDGQSAPTLSPDQLTLYYTWGEPPNQPSTARDIYRVSRNSVMDAFSDPQPQTDVDDGSSADDYASTDSVGDLWFGTSRLASPTIRIYHAVRMTDASFDTPQPVVELDSPSDADYYPVLSQDRLTVYFSRRLGGSGNFTLMTARRASPVDGFQQPTPVAIAGVTGSDNIRAGWISPDSCRLYVGNGAIAGGAITTYLVSRP